MRLVWWQISSLKYLLYKWDYYKWPHFTSVPLCVISPWGWMKFSHSVWSNLLLFLLFFTSRQNPWRIRFRAAGGSDAPWRQPSNHGSSSSSPNGGFFFSFFFISFHSHLLLSQGVSAERQNVILHAGTLLFLSSLPQLGSSSIAVITCC